MFRARYSIPSLAPSRTEKYTTASPRLRFTGKIPSNIDYRAPLLAKGVIVALLIWCSTSLPCKGLTLRPVCRCLASVCLVSFAIRLSLYSFGACFLPPSSVCKKSKILTNEPRSWAERPAPWGVSFRSFASAKVKTFF